MGNMAWAELGGSKEPLHGVSACCGGCFALLSHLFAAPEQPALQQVKGRDHDRAVSYTVFTKSPTWPSA